MVHEIRIYACMYAQGTPRVGSRQTPKINLFGLHYCVICCEVETKYMIELNE